MDKTISPRNAFQDRGFGCRCSLGKELTASAVWSQEYSGKKILPHPVEVVQGSLCRGNPCAPNCRGRMAWSKFDQFVRKLLCKVATAPARGWASLGGGH